MTQPARPEVQHQGPALHCISQGKALGWLSCTSYAVAMAIDKATLGKKQPSGCSIRRQTGDTIGGTTLPQNTAVAEAMGVDCELHVGGNVASDDMLAGNLRIGRGAVVQGNTSALLGTPNQSTLGPVNHAVYVNESRGGTTFDPDEVLVYDPAADGRDRGYHVDTSPSWWPWERLLRFAGDLRPWGDGDPRKLGRGRVYCAFFPDTEPHTHFAHGGVKTKPYPDRTRILVPEGRVARVHSIPSMSVATVVARMPRGALFTAYQVTKTGENYKGSRIWYGGHNGDRWVHESRLNHEGGST